MTERTLVLVKPDGVRRGLIGDVLSRIERKGLRIIAMDLRVLDTGIAQTHYAEHSGKPFFGPLVDFITSGPLVALVAEGPLQHQDGVVSVKGERFAALGEVCATPSHDFR